VRATVQIVSDRAAEQAADQKIFKKQIFILTFFQVVLYRQRNRWKNNNNQPKKEGQA
jgi:hypothetical protein